MPTTYSNYLKLDQLLALQQPLSADPEHDETLFIITHQVYELWFKQLIHETSQLHLAFDENQLTDGMRYLNRMLHILKVMVAQMDILETLSPISFNAFRDRLESASGFQSAQFREFEFLLGHRNPNAFKLYPHDHPGRQRLEALLQQPSLWDAFLNCLDQNGYAIPSDIKQRDYSQQTQPSEHVQQQLLQIYRNAPQLYQVCEQLTDLDEGLQEWRYRHVKMVQRTIGTRQGTGGSSGAEYLIASLMKPLFPDLWQIRSAL